MSTQPFEIKDFSGGRTDAYLDGPPNRYQIADNLLIVPHGQQGKLLSRDGSELYSSDFPNIPAAQERIGTLRNFKTNFASDVLLGHSNRDIYSLDNISGWVALEGPVDNNSLLPSTSSVSSVLSIASWNNHLYISSDDFAAPSKIFIDDNGDLQLRTAGLPPLASAPTIVATGHTGKSFTYRFLYRYDYNVGTVAFLDRGAITEVLLSNADAPQTNPNNISAIPVLSNAAITNFDTATITVEIYRTIDAGTVFYYVGAVTNGTTVYVDNTSDATLLAANQLLYTDDGSVENDQPPGAKVLFVVNDKAYYGHIKDSTGQILPNQLLQSIPGDLDSVPGDFSVDLRDEIVGGGAAKGIPVVICRNSVYRIDGAFDQLGRGGMIATEVGGNSSSCVSSQSVVQTTEGLFWAGDDSYYYTDGYQVLKLINSWNDSYKLATATVAQQKRIQGKFDRLNRRIWWTIQQSDAGSADCNACDILNLDWGVSMETSFTSASGDSEFAPTAIEFIDTAMIRGDRYGFLLSHSPGLAVDPKIDKDVTPADWVNQAIIWTYRCCAVNFGTSMVRKYIPTMVLTCANKSNVSIQITSINDDGRKVENLKPIRFRGNFIWDDPSFVWGDPSFIWGFEGLIEVSRRFPSNSLRCSYKQIEITNAEVVIATSDNFGTVTTNALAKTATLDSSATIDWPSDCVDYVLKFSTDNYQNEYPVVAATADTLTYTDTNDVTENSSGVEWELLGIPKGEMINIISFGLNVVFFGETQQFYTAGESGAIS